MTAWFTERVPGKDKRKIMQLKMHYTIKHWDVLHLDKRFSLELRTLSSHLVQVVLRDRLALKSLCSITEARYILQRHKRRKSDRTSFEKNNSARTQLIRSEVTKASHIEIWANASATVSRRNHEPRHANWKQVFFQFFNRFSDRATQSHLKEMLLCWSMANFFGSSYWKTRKSKPFGGFSGCRVDFVLRRGSGLLEDRCVNRSLNIEGNPLYQP